jgi:hypothetical protein
MPGKMHTCGLACLSVNCQASSTVKNAKGMNGLLPGGTEYPVHLQKHWWCHVLLLFNFPSFDRLLGIKHGKHKKNTAKKHCAGGRKTTHTTDFKTFVS